MDIYRERYLRGLPGFTRVFQQCGVPDRSPQLRGTECIGKFRQSVKCFTCSITLPWCQRQIAFCIDTCVQVQISKTKISKELYDPLSQARPTRSFPRKGGRIPGLALRLNWDRVILFFSQNEPSQGARGRKTPRVPTCNWANGYTSQLQTWEVYGWGEMSSKGQEGLDCISEDVILVWSHKLHSWNAIAWSCNCHLMYRVTVKVTDCMKTGGVYTTVGFHVEWGGLVEGLEAFLNAAKNLPLKHHPASLPAKRTDSEPIPDTQLIYSLMS